MKLFLIVALIVSLLALGLFGFFLGTALKRRSRCVWHAKPVRRITLEDLPHPSPSSDSSAVAAYRRILDGRLHPSRALLRSITDEERRSFASLGTEKPVVVAYATHPHRRNDILTLIDACREEFLVVVGEYTQGLTPRDGIVVHTFAAARLASFVYDGMLAKNPAFLRLCEEKEGVTVEGRFFPLEDEPLAPIARDDFSYTVDVASKAFSLATKGETKLVFRPESPVISVFGSRGAFTVETADGDFPVTAYGTGTRVRLVWCGNAVGVRISSRSSAHITVGTTDKNELALFAAHEAFRRTNTFVSFRADSVTETLGKRTNEILLRNLLRYRRTNRIDRFSQAVAVTVASPESIPLSAFRMPKEDLFPSALVVLCAKSYRGTPLSADERSVLTRAVKRAEEEGGLYRALAFKLTGLLSSEDRDAISVSKLATDALTFAGLAEQSLEEPFRSLAISLFSGTCHVSPAQLLDALDRSSDLAFAASALWLRIRLLGVRIRNGRLSIEPSLPTLSSVTVLGREIGVEKGADDALLVDGVRWYTAILPKSGDVKVVTTA